MTRRISFVAALLFMAAGVVAQAQNSTTPPPAPSAPRQNPPAQQAAPPIVVRTERVIVPVTVKDSHGQLVGDLTQGDFRILADGVEQRIVGFSAEPVPLSAVVVIDNDLGQRPEVQVQKSLVAIAAGFGPSDEAALVTYDQFPETVSDFSNNNDLLFTTLKRLELGSHNSQVIADPTTAGPIGAGGGAGPPPSSPGPLASGLPPAASVQVHGSGRYKTENALNDALFAAGDMLKARGRDRRKIIFLISDGSNSKTNEHSFDETLRSLLVSDVSVYSINVTHTVPVGKSVIQHGASELEKYAAGTGGDTFFAGKQPDLERLYAEVTEEARNQYTLTFSPEDVPGKADYHTIEIRVRRPDLNVDARSGYYESAIGVGR